MRIDYYGEESGTLFIADDKAHYEYANVPAYYVKRLRKLIESSPAAAWQLLLKCRLVRAVQTNYREQRGQGTLAI